MANYIPSEHLGEMYDSDRNFMPSKRRGLIHKHRKQMDLYGPSLPFNVGIFRPKFGHQIRDIYIACPSCDRSIFINKNTSIVICTCGKMVNVDE